MKATRISKGFMNYKYLFKRALVKYSLIMTEENDFRAGKYVGLINSQE
jgi:hypothetical protein